MIHHLRGTSAALAENVFITGGKRHGNYGPRPWVSTLLTVESTSRSPRRQGWMAPGMLSRNYNASPCRFIPNLFTLCTAFVCFRLMGVCLRSCTCLLIGHFLRNDT